jgi:hypothetical protein
MERLTDEDDGSPSPARKTIAPSQAALLNLRGQELRPLKVGLKTHVLCSVVLRTPGATRTTDSYTTVVFFSRTVLF